MAGTLDTRSDRTVTFLPHRLNRQPVIVRGLTANELWITVGLSAAGGLALGMAVAALTHRIAVVPTVIVVSIAAGVFTGGGLLRRQKRGRPDTWLYRHIQWWSYRRAPRVCAYLGAPDFITRSGVWTTRRLTRP